ncbi:MAG: helix-turn-helix domain-containing protein [Planctomycetaceae bacterium]
MLKVSDVASRLNISASKVYQLVEEGKLSHHRFDGAIRFSEEQIAAYLEETRQERRDDGKSIPHRPHLKHIRLR